MRFLKETIDVVNDDEWNISLGEQLSKQFELYQDDPEYKVLELI